MRLIVVCECSGIVRKAFRKLGHEAYSCDIKPAEDGGEHILIDNDNPTKHLQEVLLKDWDLMIGHPPCTYIALCQIWRKLKKGQEWRGDKEKEGLFFFKMLWNQNQIPKICLENPMSVATTEVAKKQQTIHPYEFGHPEQKTTWLWLKGLPFLMPTNNVYDEMVKLPPAKRYRIHYATGMSGKDRSTERSRTYQGIANAMADQWGAEFRLR